MIWASSTEICWISRSRFFSSAVSGRIPIPLVSERAMRYSHSTMTRIFMSAYSLKYAASGSAVLR